MAYECATTCPFCKRQVDYDLIRNGPNQSAHAYCNTCGMACVLSVPYLDKDDKWGLTKNKPAAQLIHPTVEQHLRYCQCGGEFRHSALPRCPHCSEELEEFKRDEYKFLTVIIGKYVKNWWKEEWEKIFPKEGLGSKIKKVFSRKGKQEK